MPTSTQASANVKLYDEGTSRGTPRSAARTPRGTEAVALRTRGAEARHLDFGMEDEAAYQATLLLRLSCPCNS